MFCKCNRAAPQSFRHSGTTLAVDRLCLDVAGNGSIRHLTSIRRKTKDSRLIA